MTDTNQGLSPSQLCVGGLHTIFVGDPSLSVPTHNLARIFRFSSFIVRHICMYPTSCTLRSRLSLSSLHRLIFFAISSPRPSRLKPLRGETRNSGIPTIFSADRNARGYVTGMGGHLLAITETWIFHNSTMCARVRMCVYASQVRITSEERICAHEDHRRVQRTASLLRLRSVRIL